MVRFFGNTEVSLFISSCNSLLCLSVIWLLKSKLNPKPKPGNQKEIISGLPRIEYFQKQNNICSKYYWKWFWFKIYCVNRCFEYLLKLFKIPPFYKIYLLFHTFWFIPYPFHWIKKCLCVSQLHIAVEILSSLLETIYMQNHANYERMLHPAMSILIIYPWWTPACVAFGLGESLENVCVLDN